MPPPRRRDHCFGNGKQRHRKHLLTTELKRRATRDQYLELWAGGKQLAEQRGGAEHLLKVIQNEQRGPLGKKGTQGAGKRHVGLLTHPKYRSHSVGN